MKPRPLAVLAAVLACGALAACGGASGGAAGEEPVAAPVPADGPPDAQEITVVGTPGLDYEPATISARPGTLTLHLRTDSGPPHDLVFDDESLPSIPAVPQGQERSGTYAFSSPGTFAFVCTFHPGMEGEVVVS